MSTKALIKCYSISLLHRGRYRPSTTTSVIYTTRLTGSRSLKRKVSASRPAQPHILCPSTRCLLERPSVKDPSVLSFVDEVSTGIRSKFLSLSKQDVGNARLRCCFLKCAQTSFRAVEIGRSHTKRTICLSLTEEYFEWYILRSRFESDDRTPFCQQGNRSTE